MKKGFTCYLTNDIKQISKNFKVEKKIPSKTFNCAPWKLWERTLQTPIHAEDRRWLFGVYQVYHLKQQTFRK